MPIRKPVHVDPAAMPAAGAPSSAAGHHHGKACTGPPPHQTTSPSRRKAVVGPSRESLASVLRPTASSNAKNINGSTAASTSAGDDVGTFKTRRPILKRTQGAPASVAHLKGASLLTPRSPRVSRFARNHAAVTAAARAKLLAARGLNESPSPRPAPANRPRVAAPYATESIPAGVKKVPATFEPKRIRHPVANQEHAPERLHRRKPCKPVTPRLFAKRGKAKVAGAGAEHGNVLAPAPASPVASKAFESSRHVATEARVDHEAVPFGSVGHTAQDKRSFSRHVAPPVPAPDRARGLRHIRPGNPTERTLAVGAQTRSVATATCPFDRSYERSPFAPPTARGQRNNRKQWSAPKAALGRTVVDERPF